MRERALNNNSFSNDAHPSHINYPGRFTYTEISFVTVKSSATKIPTPGMTFVLIVLVAGTLGSLRSSAGAAGNRPGAHEGCVTRWKIK